MNWTLLQKYLSNECDPEEKKRVNAWLQSSRKNRDFMKTLEKIWEVDPRSNVTVDAKSAWASFQHKLSNEKKRRTQKVSKNRFKPFSSNRKFGRTKAISLAAAALILLAFLSYVFVPQFNSGSSELAGNQAEMEIITTRRGQRTTLRLGDGTRVHLNAASMIKIPADFGDSTRDVYLKGEAYFEVTHNPQKPFLVHTPTAYTKVLGTKFGVKAYPEDTRVQVVVKEGRVALDLSATPDTTHNKIIKNHMGVLSPKGSLKISEVKELSSYLGWKDGRLVFKSTPFREMVPKLERWYDINIAVVDSSLNSRQMTASFKDEPVSEVLKIIALSLDAGYDRKGQEVTFHSN